MARRVAANVIGAMWLTFLLLSVCDTCHICPFELGVYICTQSPATCVRIGKSSDPVREIRLSSCTVKIDVPIDGWGGQLSSAIVRDKNGIVCSQVTTTLRRPSVKTTTQPQVKTTLRGKTATTQSLIMTTLRAKTSTTGWNMKTTPLPRRDNTVDPRSLKQDEDDAVRGKTATTQSLIMTTLRAKTSTTGWNMKTTPLPRRDNTVDPRSLKQDEDDAVRGKTATTQSLIMTTLRAKTSTTGWNMKTIPLPHRDNTVDPRSLKQDEDDAVRGKTATTQSLIMTTLRAKTSTTGWNMKTIPLHRRDNTVDPRSLYQDEDDADNLFDGFTATGFLAWAVTCTLAIILLIIRRYLIKTFSTCPCSHGGRNGFDTPAESREEVPLSDMTTPPPTGDAPNAARPMDSPNQPTPDVSSCFKTPPSNLPPEISTPSSSKPLLDAPAYNTRAQKKVLFK